MSVSTNGAFLKQGLVKSVDKKRIIPRFASDPYYNQTSFLCGSTPTNDTYSSMTVTNNGVTTDTATYRAGESSLGFDGNSYLSTPYFKTKFSWFKSKLFTVEAWVFADSYSTWSQSGSIVEIPCMIGNMNPTIGTVYWAFGPRQDNKLGFSWYNGSSNQISTDAVLVPGQWTHVAFTLDYNLAANNTTARLFVNGNMEYEGIINLSGALDYSNTNNANATLLTVGKFNNTGITGNINDIRITQGVCRYTESFTLDKRGVAFDRTPGPFDTLSANVTSLVRFEGNLYDEPVGSNGYGSATPPLYVTTGNGVDGTYAQWFGGRFANARVSTDRWNFGTGDYCIETWAFVSYHLGGGTSNNDMTVFGYNGSSGATRLWFINFNGLPSYWNGTVQQSSNIITPTGIWFHLAYTREAGVFRIFLNGKKILEQSNTISISLANAYIFGHAGLNNRWFNGYSDLFRITKGVARYTEDFIPPNDY